MPQSPLTGQFKRKADIQYRVRCLYSSFVHGLLKPSSSPPQSLALLSRGKELRASLVLLNKLYDVGRGQEAITVFFATGSENTTLSAIKTLLDTVHET
jgi:hypothetical protein